MRRPTIVLASVLALLLAAGCGGSESTSASGTESAATVAPASAAAYVAISSDSDSDQWRQAMELLDRFPGSDEIVADLRRELSEEDVDWEQDVDPALGPETAVVVIGDDNEIVALTQPDDDAKLDALLARMNEDSDDELVKREVDGWTAVAESTAILDAFDRAREQGQLEDEEDFQDVFADLPEEALVKAYVPGSTINRAAEDASGTSPGALTGGNEISTLALALEARDDGVTVSGTSTLSGELEQEPYEATLLERVPDDALAVLSFRDLGSAIEGARSAEGLGPGVGQLEQALGVSLEEIGGLFGGETILYVRSGAPLPEVTLLAEVDDEARAAATVDRLATRAAALTGSAGTGTAEVDGLEVKYVDLQGVRVSYTTFDGLLAVTTGPAGIRDARGGGDKIGDDERFQAAKEAAGMGDETNGFVYVDLEDAIPLIESFAALAEEQIPPEVSGNLAPLETFLVYATADGETARFSATLGIDE
jgi:hypothetical protein